MKTARLAYHNELRHQLRTPITGMQAFLSMLSSGRYGNMDTEALADAAKAEKLLKRLFHLVNEFFDSVELEKGHVELHCDVMPVDRVVRDAIEIAQDAAKARKIELIYNDKTGGAHINVDSERLLRVVHKLLSVQIARSDYKGRVGIGVKTESERVKISVLGRTLYCGKAEESDSSSEMHRDQYRQDGGFDLCRAIVEQHQGEMGKTAFADGVVVFWIRLPIARVH